MEREKPTKSNNGLFGKIYRFVSLVLAGVEVQTRTRSLNGVFTLSGVSFREYFLLYVPLPMSSYPKNTSLHRLVSLSRFQLWALPPSLIIIEVVNSTFKISLTFVSNRYPNHNKIQSFI
jgi:hypothetical protein